MTNGAWEVGLRDRLIVREERLTWESDPCRLVYVSDIHLRPRRSRNLCEQVIESVRSLSVQAILLGGDLVDCASELVALCQLVKSLTREAPVFAVGGNHDSRVGLQRVEEAVVSGGGRWIHDSWATVRHGARMIGLAGPEAACLPAGEVRVLCAHNPRIWNVARRRGYDLVLAGHLHGCQLVAFEFRDRLFPGVVFYPYCLLRYRRGAARLVVSRGVSDLLPVRWRCPREVVLCYV